MPYKVVVDRSLCIGCGAAPSLCPQVFKLREDDGKNMVVEKYEVEFDADKSVGLVPEDLHECLMLAKESCPVNAIKVFREE